jgi:hypothetical protein
VPFWRASGLSGSLTVRDPFSASLDYRRRFISDLTWLGLGVVAGGFGILAQVRGWPRLLSIPLILIGLAMIVPAALRRIRRSS